MGEGQGVGAGIKSDIVLGDHWISLVRYGLGTFHLLHKVKLKVTLQELPFESFRDVACQHHLL